MKTLLIGDLHLKSQLILPIVDKIIQTHNRLPAKLES